VAAIISRADIRRAVSSPTREPPKELAAMRTPRDGQVSLLVQFPPIEVRAAAAWLAQLLQPIDDVMITLDASGGNLELSNVRGVDLRHLTDRLYERGARCVFVRYEHEGQRVSIAYGADDGRDPRKGRRERPESRDPRPN
jgi:hypothetical protein